MKSTITVLIFMAFINMNSYAAIKKNVAYGTHADQKMDLYLLDTAANAPIMIYVHGGGWGIGDKARIGVKDQFFNSKGWIFASINYRLIPEGAHPANVEDVAQAVAWVHDHIAKHGGDPESIFIMGHSAGAHLVALVGTDPRSLKKAGKDLSIIKGVVALDTQAYDIPELMKDSASKLYREVFGENPNFWRDASPIYHIKKDTGIPPFLICFSRGMGRLKNPDRLKQADNFSTALGVFGIKGDVIDASDRNHGEINQWFGKSDDGVVTKAAEAFLDAILTGKKTMFPTPSASLE